MKELSMLVTALCTACFSRAKINKKLWPLYSSLRFGPPTLNALAPALKVWMFVHVHVQHAFN